MGQRGPQPTPTEILKLRGSWKADERQNELRPDPAMPTAPHWLSDGAREQWDYYAPMLFNLGVLTLNDRDTLAIYCASVDEFAEASQACERDGTMIDVDGKSIRNPALLVRNEARNAARQYGVLLGLSPGSRAGMAVAMNGPKRTKSKEDKYFSGSPKAG